MRNIQADLENLLKAANQSFCSIHAALGTEPSTPEFNRLRAVNEELRKAIVQAKNGLACFDAREAAIAELSATHICSNTLFSKGQNFCSVCDSPFIPVPSGMESVDGDVYLTTECQRCAEGSFRESCASGDPTSLAWAEQ